jgi:rSAM/selenodomain-associated transferase 2/rSAM/selenodomain-associated transferase 1
MPCLNEAGGIAATLRALQPLRARGAEVIVADGGSSDDSVALATPLADRVVAAPRGRAAQMNAGAAHARGEVLLFLHADCTLPPEADTLILDGLTAGGRAWGRFDVRLAGRHPLLPVIAALMNLRSRLSGIATGDQGLFVRRTLFDAAGGYAAMPLMEDIELCRRLKKHGAPLCLRARLTTSARRWEQHGVLRTILLMWRLRLAYFFGADAVTLARQYAGAPDTGIAVFAKAPEPGLAKTRLIALLGAAGAAQLQQQLTARALATAQAAGTGAVTLWCAPDAGHPLLREVWPRRASQCAGDLGARLHAAAAAMLAAHAGVILIGTDCPALTADTLRTAARALADHDAAIAPAEDGGYVLLALRRTDPRLFTGVDWGSDTVMASTRRNLAALGWRWLEMPVSWDVDRAADFARLRASGLMPETAVLDVPAGR